MPRDSVAISDEIRATQKKLQRAKKQRKGELAHYHSVHLQDLQKELQAVQVEGC
ncbi:MAG: hypothetical protein A4E49_03160 [Methanosaeta sp. PtaU1.Bin112]|nr:MAG: hypothetical protein A4E49_03160 [Methanosaeta sp. PtaU1.Bin112]